MNSVRHSRREFLRAIGVGAATLAFPNLLQGQMGDGKRPNVLFIAVDDLRPQLRCYGDQRIVSPNIDRLAAGGVVFNRCYCQSPVCGASRASLLSGLRPTRDRHFVWDLHADKQWGAPLSLPRHFREQGYHTISNGKIYHYRNDGRGSWTEPAWIPEGKWVGRGYVLEENQKIAREAASPGIGPAYECADVGDSDYPDGAIADKAIADLRRLTTNTKPFFLAVGFHKPHLPFNAPKKYWDLYDRDKIELADNPYRPTDAPNAAIHNWGELRQYHDIPKEGPLSDEMARTLIHGYRACTSYTDAQIGRVLKELDRLDLSDNTIVVLWGDHGWNLGEHTLWCKHCHFKTSLRSTLVVRVPGLKGGAKTDGLAEFVDIYPSLCELAGLRQPEHLEGRSFVPLLKEPGRAWKEAIYSRYNEGESVRTDRYCYTEWAKGNAPAYSQMLYDETLDPEENVNIAERPENAEIVKDLAEKLHRFRAGYKS